MTRYRRKFHRIARGLTNLELQRSSSDFSFSMKGILDDLEQSHGSEFFMGFYSEAGILEAFDQFGITKTLRRKGFEDLRLMIDTKDQYRQLLRIYSGKKDPGHLLGEIVIRKARYKYTSGHRVPEQLYPLGLLTIEWLILQDPTSSFTAAKPALPGQDHPGLGVGSQILELLYLMAKHQQTQGLLVVPHYYHTALIFSKEFRFLNPGYQGILERIEHDLRTYSFLVRAWGVECGAVFHKYDNSPFHWDPEEQILPCDKELHAYLHSPNYQNAVQKTREHAAFYLDTTLLHDKLPSHLQLDDLTS